MSVWHILLIAIIAICAFGFVAGTAKAVRHRSWSHGIASALTGWYGVYYLLFVDGTPRKSQEHRPSGDGMA
ncbi:MAG: hypothetical protein ACMVY4_18670 [Minwuia sp.]|uniref:hypothetical protein n=1 Tax=Minwuia sp. TaxID=2493630 RepID=UPI003A8A80C3